MSWTSQIILCISYLSTFLVISNNTQCFINTSSHLWVFQEKDLPVRNGSFPLILTDKTTHNDVSKITIHKATKTETLDLCQLPRPPFEIHKMINLLASIKIFKNKLKNRETDKSYFYLPHQVKGNNKLIKKILSCLMAS